MTTITLTVTLNSKLNNGGGGGPLPPSNTVAPVISGSSVIGSTLTSTTGTWTGTPVINYAYQWKRNGGNIGGATSSTYILVNADYNNAITCEVTATNIAGSASATSNSITGTATAPSNIVPPVISGSNVVGQTLSCSTGTWTGTPTPTYSYTWYRGASVISGATASTYTLVQADATFVITCVVVATNAAGSLGSTSNSLTILDADADAFITAANITDNTQKTAINQLVVDLKGYGIWSKMKAIYPFVGGTASTHKFNLKDPRDLDAAFRLVFNGGWTHSSTGALPNGTNGYADTYLRPGTTLGQNSLHLSFYSRTNQASASATEMGCRLGGAQPGVMLGLKNSFFAGGQAFTRLNSLSNYTAKFVNSDSTGYYFGIRTNSTQESIWKNGSKIVTGTESTIGNPNINIYISADNQDGLTTVSYSAKQVAFATIGDGLTDTDATNLYIATETFQTALGRNVGVPIVSDPDAQAFLFAAQITNTTEANAVNQLVISMKAQGLWSKMKAIYPFVGGTASTHKFNLKDPRDLDAAFRLVFNGGWTHSSTGALPNGTNGYANTFFNLQTQSTVNNTSFGAYIRTNSISGSQAYGSFQNPLLRAFHNLSLGNIQIADNGAIFYTPNISTGLFLSRRESNIFNESYRNGVSIGTTNSLTNTLPNYNFYFGATNNNGAIFNYTTHQIAFGLLGGNGTLTNADSLILYTIIQTFQTSLSRQV